MKRLCFHHFGKLTGFWLVVLANLLPVAAPAQTTLVKGVVTRAATGERLPSVNVTIPGTTIGTNTDPNGSYALQLPQQYQSLTFSYLGYRPETRLVVPGREQVINVALAEASQ